MSKTTQAALDNYIGSYTQFNDWLIARRYQRLKDFFVGTECLELGSAEGMGTGFLLEGFEKVVAVDGSEVAIDEVKRRFDSPKLETVHSFFEDLDLKGRTFSTIVMAHILEHVDDPKRVLLHARNFIDKDGVMIIDVPNGNSLHRQVGVKMGLLKEKTELNEADLSIGHQRVYTPETFRSELEACGLEIVRVGGMFIKVLSNSQTEKVFNEEQLEALFWVGEDNPEIAAEIYAVVKLKA
jgi:2-polyprenyl-3-methyl-5-hydroxy-6-metoxy-1,4-benzoquinol methylase